MAAEEVGAATLPTGAATETTLSAINTKTPTLGQKAMAGSHPVVLAVDQTEIPVQIKGLLQNDLTSASVALSSVRGLNVSVVEPLTAFGELLTAHPTPRIQIDAIYGLLETDVRTFAGSLSGSVTASGAMFTCQTGSRTSGPEPNAILDGGLAIPRRGELFDRVRHANKRHDYRRATSRRCQRCDAKR